MHIQLCIIKFWSLKSGCILKLDEEEGVTVLELLIARGLLPSYLGWEDEGATLLELPIIGEELWLTSFLC
jgi:hypothetical protein